MQCALIVKWGFRALVHYTQVVGGCCCSPPWNRFGAWYGFPLFSLQIPWRLLLLLLRLFTGTVDEESFFENERTSGIKQWRDALQSLFSISRLLLCIFSERTTLNGPDRLSHALLMMMAMICPAPPQNVFKQRAPLCFRHSSWFATWKYETYSTEILPFNFSRGPNQRPSFTTPSKGKSRGLYFRLSRIEKRISLAISLLDKSSGDEEG